MFINKFIEKIIYKVREIFWNYPDYLFFGKRSIAQIIYVIYNKFRPFSHIILSLTVILFIIFYFLTDINKIVRANTETYIEGVMVGVDESGNLNTIQRVNPLVVSNIQIEKDLSELIYESLVEVHTDGEVEYNLVESIAVNEAGDNYRIKLKDNIYWHDHSEIEPHKFTVKDVEATFNVLERLDTNFSTKTIYSTIANKRVKFIPIQGDDYRFEFQLEGAIPNFYELISFKILPAKYIEDLGPWNILSGNPFINAHPIGTGMYKLGNAGDNFIELRRFDNYYNLERIPSVKTLKFCFYPDEETLIKGLKSGVVHAAGGMSSDTLQKLKPLSHIDLYKTGVVFNQYYGLYFNLAENGPEFLKEKKLRQAISSAINREYIIEILEGDAKESFGPIAENSFAYAKKVSKYTFNPLKSEELLKEAGWAFEENSEYRTKDGNVLEFNFVSLDNVDRNKVVDSIVEDLKVVGIKINVIRKTNIEIINEHILPRNYEILLYSMTTFIDPDRYELFHSSQIEHPGLNISSYKSSEETVKIIDKKVKKIPEVDFRLEKGRSLLDEETRKEEYFEFQRIILEDLPMVFLYHPKLNYVVSKRVKGIDIENANTLEKRFKNIFEWRIVLDKL